MTKLKLYKTLARPSAYTETLVDRLLPRVPKTVKCYQDMLDFVQVTSISLNMVDDVTIGLCIRLGIRYEK